MRDALWNEPAWPKIVSDWNRREAHSPYLKYLEGEDLDACSCIISLSKHTGMPQVDGLYFTNRQQTRPSLWRCAYIIEGKSISLIGWLLPNILATGLFETITFKSVNKLDMVLAVRIQRIGRCDLLCLRTMFSTVQLMQEENKGVGGGVQLIFKVVHFMIAIIMMQDQLSFMN